MANKVMDSPPPVPASEGSAGGADAGARGGSSGARGGSSGARDGSSGARDGSSGARDGSSGAGSPGGPSADGEFSAQLEALRLLLANPPQDDTIAERYNELLEAARGDEARLAALRVLGAELRALQDAGDLPRTMIARAPRRPRG